MRFGKVVGAVAALAAAAAPFAPVSAVAAEPTVQTITSGLAGPLQIAVGTEGTIYVGQSFAATLTTIDKKGNSATLATAATGEIAGVDAKGKGTTVYTTSDTSPEAGPTFAQLKRVQPNGKTEVLADLLQYEQTVNPDQDVEYGPVGLSTECAAQLPPPLAPYTGIVDSHPYAVAIGNGEYYVADAAGNDILRVGANGRISTVAVLPPQPATITEAFVTAEGLPSCITGATFNFEPVPTDVEIGPDGMLYVSTLPGGPEGPQLGARGSVYRVNPRTGAMTQLATGFAGATNVAVAPNGTVYVAELFGNRVSKIAGGTVSTVIDLPMPAGVEYDGGKLYVSYNVFGNGTVGVINL